MRSFHSDRLTQVSVPAGTAWLMGACMEARGKQEAWKHRKPELLEALRDLSVIQSAESSNRIEGVTVSRDRLRPLVLGDAVPVDRPEEELVGYRRALNWIHGEYREISVTPNTIQRLHALAQGGMSGDAGRWKERDNEIIELLPNGERRIRFVPISAAAIPHAIEQLCLGYRHAVQQELLPPLLAAGALIFDLLCVHPFRDGNGRVSRLLTLLVLYQQGFEVGRYLSLERLVEESRETYFDVLAASSANWHEAAHDLVPWWNHFLSTLRRAYVELEERLEVVDTGPGKSELVRQAVLRRTNAFTLQEILKACPSVSPQLARKVLSQMKADGLLTLTSRGRGARWHRG